MSHLRLKLRVAYLPFLLISPLCIGACILFNWLMVINGHVMINGWVTDFLIPVLVPLAVSYIWYSPRVKLFQEIAGNHMRTLLVWLAWFTTSSCTFLAQYYLTAQTGKLTQLGNITDALKAPETKYYKVAHYFADTSLAGIDFSIVDEGKYGLHYRAKMATPMYAQDPAIQADAAIGAWLITDNDQEIDRAQPDSIKDALWDKFTALSKQKMVSGSFNFTYLQRLTKASKNMKSATGVARKGFSYHEPVILFTPCYGAYENRAGRSFMWIWLSFGIGAAAMFIVMAIANPDKSQLQKLNQTSS